jgi:phosphatidate phosphatase PAH1
VNGDKTPLNMKLSSSGDAYFLQDKRGSVTSAKLSNLNLNLSVEKKEDNSNSINEVCENKNVEITDKLEAQFEMNESFESPIDKRKSAPSTPTELGKKLEKFQINDDESKNKYFIIFLNLKII